MAYISYYMVYKAGRDVHIVRSTKLQE